MGKLNWLIRRSIIIGDMYDELLVRSRRNHEMGIVAFVTDAGSSSDVRLKNH